MGLPPAAYQQVHWREGSNSTLSSRFAHCAYDRPIADYWRSEQREEDGC